MPVLSPVSLRSDGSGSKALPKFVVKPPMVPMLAPAASESHSIRSSVYVSDSSPSKLRSGSINVRIMSWPMMYTDLSDWSTPLRRSNVAESVTVLGLPDASVGSVYSTVRMSPCRIQCWPKLSPNLPCVLVSGTTVPPSVTISPLSFTIIVLSPSGTYCVVCGHCASAGPSVYLSARSSSNMPASGAISVIGPSSLVVNGPVGTTSLSVSGTIWPFSILLKVPSDVSSPSFASSPPAVATITDEDPRETTTLSGPWVSCPLLRGTLTAIVSSPFADMSKSGSFILT